MQKPSPVLAAHLFADIRTKLIDLLESLTAEEWTRQTAAPLWTVKDIALH